MPTAAEWAKMEDDVGSEDDGDEDEESDEKPKVEYATFGLNEDVWSNTFLTIVRISDIPSTGQSGHKSIKALWVLQSVLFWVTNLVLQIAIMWIVEIKAIQPELDKYRLPAFDTIKAISALDTATAGHGFDALIPDKLNQKFVHDILVRCDKQQAKDVTVIYFMILFLWFARALNETFLSINFCLNVYYIHIRKNQREPMENQKEHLISQVDSKVKILSYIFVGIPKIGIACFLGYCGGQLLMSQFDVMHVVFKCICLQLIVSIDDLIIKGLATHGAIQRLKGTKIKFENFRTVHWDNWLGGFVKYAIVLGLSLYFYSFCGEHLTPFRKSCARYRVKFPLAVTE